TMADPPPSYSETVGGPMRASAIPTMAPSAAPVHVNVVQARTSLYGPNPVEMDCPYCQVIICRCYSTIIRVVRGGAGRKLLSAQAIDHRLSNIHRPIVAYSDIDGTCRRCITVDYNGCLFPAWILSACAMVYLLHSVLCGRLSRRAPFMPDLQKDAWEA
uniref:LITAF domain-containing protein n=1 Tax=Parascaris univalens TaxID=6257 RepID=A0A915ABB4_PARUN